MRVRCRVRALVVRVLMRSRCWAKLTYSVDGGGRGGRRVKQEGWRRTISNGSPLRCTTRVERSPRQSVTRIRTLSPSRSPTLAAFATSLPLPPRSLRAATSCCLSWIAQLEPPTNGQVESSSSFRAVLPLIPSRTNSQLDTALPTSATEISAAAALIPRPSLASEKYSYTRDQAFCHVMSLQMISDGKLDGVTWKDEF
jgi:hypothetical protein